MPFRYLMGTLPKIESFHLLLVGNSGTMRSEFPSREKSGGVGVDANLWIKLLSPKDQKDESDFGACLPIYTFWSARFVFISPGNNDPAST